MEKEKLYDGSERCGVGACLVAERDRTHNTVTLHDPQKPERGSITMTAKEWNDLITNAVTA